MSKIKNKAIDEANEVNSIATVKKSPKVIAKVEEEKIVVEQEVKRVYEMLDENCEKHNFDESPIFEGIFDKTITITPDDKSKKPFDLHLFYDLKGGEKVAIDSSYSITKMLNGLKEQNTDFSKTAIYIEFVGKTTVNGKPFNKFNLGKASL